MLKFRPIRVESMIQSKRSLKKMKERRAKKRLVDIISLKILGRVRKLTTSMVSNFFKAFDIGLNIYLIFHIKTILYNNFCTVFGIIH
jgi:hypothetical protein